MERFLAQFCKLLPKPQRFDTKEESVLNHDRIGIWKIMKKQGKNSKCYTFLKVIFFIHFKSVEILKSNQTSEDCKKYIPNAYGKFRKIY